MFRKVKKIPFDQIRRRPEKHEGIMMKLQYPIVDRLIYLFYHLGVTGNEVSFLMMLFSFIGPLFLFLNNYWLALIGLYLTIFADHLDYVDGAVARLRNQFSKKGTVMDAFHHAFDRSIYFLAICIFYTSTWDRQSYIGLFAFLAAFVCMFNYMLAKLMTDGARYSLKKEGVMDKFYKYPWIFFYGCFTEWIKWGFFISFIIGLDKIFIILLALWSTFRVIILPFMILIRMGEQNA